MRYFLDTIAMAQKLLKNFKTQIKDEWHMTSLAEVQKSIISDLVVTLVTTQKDSQKECDFSFNFK